MAIDQSIQITDGMPAFRPARYRAVWMFILAVSFGLTRPGWAQVERIWLTHRSHDPGRIVVNWETTRPGDSTVRYGLTADHGRSVSIAERTTRHQVEIPLPERDTVYHYSVRSGDQVSADATFKGYPTQELRVAVVANWQRKPNLNALMQEDIHLLLTAGDHIANLYEDCGVGRIDCTRPFAKLIDAYPGLFRSVPVMPVLGNHDRQIRPRGSQPPAEPVYDIEATSFREFFALPGEEWKWYFDVPPFPVRFVALDLNHISDLGTTWQTCHSYTRNSPQYEWYRRMMESTRQRFVITLYNEKNSLIRRQENSSWHQMIRNGTVAVSGFGHFAERAELDGVTYYNTSLQGRGDRYPDPQSVQLTGEDNYLLLTFTRPDPSMTVTLKSLDGRVLDQKDY